MSATGYAWADELFRRFDSLYGRQRMGIHWLNHDRQSEARRWEAALRDYTRPTIRRTVQALRDQIGAGGTSIPTVDEFTGLCAALEGRPVWMMPRPRKTHTRRLRPPTQPWPRSGLEHRLSRQRP